MSTLPPALLSVDSKVDVCRNGFKRVRMKLLLALGKVWLVRALNRVPVPWGEVNSFHWLSHFDLQFTVIAALHCIYFSTTVQTIKHCYAVSSFMSEEAL